MNSALAKSEAVLAGCDEAVFLDENGNVAEGSAENLFIVRDGSLVTPDTSSSILEGIVRKSIIQIASDLNIPVIERKIARTELYSADEVFFVGSGVQVAWVKTIDHRDIHTGNLGPITKRIQENFFSIVNGNNEKYRDWLTTV